MTHHLVRFGALLAITFLAVAPVAQAQGTPNAVIRVTPAAVQVPVGQMVDVAVEAADVQALYAADISLAFDPNAIEIVDADPNTDGAQVALGTFLDAGFVILNRADNSAGTLQFAMTQLNPSQPKDGTGPIIVVKLRGKVNGAKSPLTLTKVKIVRRDGSVIPATLNSGQAEVIQAAAGPTYTPIPTQAQAAIMTTLTPIASPKPASTQKTQPPAAAPALTPIATPGSPSNLFGMAAPMAFFGAACVLAVVALIAIVIAVVVPMRQRKPRG